MGSARQKLIDIGITNFVPGFMDDAAFLQAWKNEPGLASYYGHFIDELELDKPYLEYARSRIIQLAHFLHPLLVKEGRLGACVDASDAISRMLDREGIWNYCAKGGLSIYPNPGLNVPPSHFAPVSRQTASAPHVWVVAPPFRIIDLTVKLQPSASDTLGVTPDFILSENAAPARTSAEDWIDPLHWQTVVGQLGHIPTMADIPGLMKSETLQTFERLGAWEVAESRARFRYLALEVGGTLELLEEIDNIKFGGMFPAAAYEAFLRSNGS